MVDPKWLTDTNAFFTVTLTTCGETFTREGNLAWLLDYIAFQLAQDGGAVITIAHK